MEISTDILSFFAINNPKTTPTLLYLMARVDGNRDVVVDIDLISTILDQEPFETEEYLDRLIEADFIELLPTVNKYGQPIYHVL